MRFDDELAGTRVVVIGGSSPLGQAVAATARVAGAHVITTSRAPAAEPDVLRLDLSDEDSIQRAAEGIEACDHVICVAAARADGDLDCLESSNIRASLEAKVIGPILLAKHLRGRWRAGGSFTVVSGVADERPTPGSLVMSVANGAVNTMVRALALELAPVRVNAVSPGMIDTGTRPTEVIAAMAARLPTGMVAGPEIIADAIWAVATNPYITGSVLSMDGGLRLATH